ncbi:GNAT family N-acetyltransferase [Cellvibrio polysaccharolyticus]|uniref:GNAT family N-acetyltransferase n=1 Tax=Cellvibrio polysaccharolyticus TaxID=2082724 RepID=A0A928V6W2_9GAMM|nr:GNAT family N-acetyltransferase [Cellvibrio polysaccharolyticus]MBE8717184.1 GNAT family N-acetyltransferase [Cellvibrio polysaccharolyticus]
MSITISAISAVQTRVLRARILRPHQQPEELVYEGDDDADTLHVGAFSNKDLCGIATLVHRALDGNRKEGEWLLRGMATTPEVRGQGVGKAILQTAINHCQQAGGSTIWCKARENALGFYEAAGFDIVSEPFDVPEIGMHRVMRLML